MTLAEVEKLPPEEQFDILSSIWDRIASANLALPISEEEKELLDARLQKYSDDPGRPWSDVKAEILSKINKK